MLLMFSGRPGSTLETLTASVNPAASEIQSTSRSLIAVLGSLGSITNRTQRVAAATLSTVSLSVRLLFRKLPASLAALGNWSRISNRVRLLASALNEISNTLEKQTTAAFTATSLITGALNKIRGISFIASSFALSSKVVNLTSRKLVAIVGLSTQVVRLIIAPLIAAQNIASLLTRRITRTPNISNAGMLGTLSKTPQRALAVALALVGSPVFAFFYRQLSAIVAVSNNAIRKTTAFSSTASLIVAAVAAKTTQRAIAATLATVGTFQHGTGAVFTAASVFSETLIRVTNNALASLVKPAAIVSRNTARAVGNDTVTFGSIIAKGLVWPFAGLLVNSASFNRTINAVVVSILSTTSIVSNATWRSLASVTTLIGAIGRSRGLLLSSAAMLGGASGRITKKYLAALAALIGLQTKRTTRSMLGSLQAAGTTIYGVFHYISVFGILQPSSNLVRMTMRIWQATMSVATSLVVSIKGVTQLSLVAATVFVTTINRNINALLGDAALSTSALLTKRLTKVPLIGIVKVAGITILAHINTTAFNAVLAVAGLPIAKAISNVVFATITVASAQQRQVRRAVGAMLKPSDALYRATAAIIGAGTTNASGSLTRSAKRMITGSVIGAGSIAQATKHVFVTLLLLTASIQNSANRQINSAIALVSVFRRSTLYTLATAQLILISNTAKSLNKAPFSGVLKVSGNLGSLLIYVAYITFTSSANTVSSLSHNTARVFDTAFGINSGLGKSMTRALTASATLTAILAKSFGKWIFTSIIASGNLANELLLFLVLVSGSLGLSGRILKSNDKAIASVIVATAQIRRIYKQQIRVMLNLTANVAYGLARSLSGSALATGTFGKGVSRVINAVVLLLSIVSAYLAGPVNPIVHPYIMLATPITEVLQIMTPILVNAEE